MHSSMTSSSNRECQGMYDIFLSFRGLDTREKFTNHLNEYLKREGFRTFMDEYDIERGKIIKSELQKAIRNSRMSIIVLSKNYTNSTACLFEVQTIIEHRKKSDHFILPVFYEIDPFQIKDQAKSLDLRGEKVTDEEVKTWSAALAEVARISGMDYKLQSNGNEAKFINEIVGEVKRKLADNHLELDENMQNLKRKVEYLSGQENDIFTEISNAVSQPYRPKKEVEVWLTHVQRVKVDVEKLEHKVVGEKNVSSRAPLGKDIIKKSQEVTDLQEKGSKFNGLFIDELPTGGLLIPLPQEFLEYTTARNTENIVWKCLMNDDIRKIGVYGMGGIGKTTIMKDIHNQLLKKKGKFDSVYWITVSQTWNIPKLQRGIARSLMLSLRNDEDEITTASELYSALSLKKKHVLILDDLWEAFPLEMVGIPEPTRSNGCKILLTSRSLVVCRGMYCEPVKVELLTEQEALTLFLSKAIGNNKVLASEVEEIAVKISEKCARLPLAIVTVAGSMRELNGIREWRNALYELINSTKEVSTAAESKVFEHLKFSYNRLGDKVLQDCFLYCSLYPEDHDIPVRELIEYWIAEGLIAEMNSVEAMFNKGHAILGKLTSSCLLESVTFIRGKECLRMHDLIRDMALRITTSGPRFMVKAGVILESVPDEDWSEDLNKISFMFSRIKKVPRSPPLCPRLTTLLLRCIHLSENPPDSIYSNMKCLKVLDLSYNNMWSLPESISSLEKLHTLILARCTKLVYVPSLEKLKALKELKLTSSQIKVLPEGTEKLVNLRKLDLSNNRSLTFPSCKLCGLLKLQYLKIDGTRVRVSAEDLLRLRQLKVVAVHFYNVQMLKQYLASQQCQGLENYILSVGWEYTFSQNPIGNEVCIDYNSEPFGTGVNNQLVLPANIGNFLLCRVHDLISLSAIPSLNNARKLRRCEVACCNGLESIFSSLSFSEDGEISLGTVETFYFSDLPSFRVLFEGISPPSNISFSLKQLTLSDCHFMKNIIPVQFLQNFPNLQELNVVKCENVEDIIVEKGETNRDHGRDDSNTISLPKLQTLSLRYLPRLKSIYNGVMVCQSIEVITVEDCPMLRRLPLSLDMESKQASPPPSLRLISGDGKWWESLEWNDPLIKTLLDPFLNRRGWTVGEIYARL